MPQPNIIVILIDDMGARDLGCTGSTFYETPHLDRLAAEGVNFTCGYAASPVCSPARAALMTGRAPARVGITNYIPGNAQGRLLGAPYHFSLPPQHRTIATALREGGYRTWHVGKWHLGGEAEGSMPTDHGFDVNVAGNHAGSVWGLSNGYWGPFVTPDGQTLPGMEDTRAGEYMTDRLTDEAIGLIRNHSPEQPFFLHLSHFVVHTAIQAPADLVTRYEAKARRLGLDRLDPLVPGEPLPVLHLGEQVALRRMFQSRPDYAAMIHNLDDNVGRLMQALRETGQDENTLIVFLSDNGGLSVGVEGSVTCNLPYREGKGWMEEGGTRVPFLMRWPAGFAGGRVSDMPIWQCDLYPTFLQAAGLPLEPQHHCEGESLMGLLACRAGACTPPSSNTGTCAPPAAGSCRAGARTPPPYDRPFFWHYPNYPNQGATPSGAIRQGDWKLIECFETGRLSLYNLAEDLTETTDLAERHPALAQQLHERLLAWRQDVGALMPTPNPYYEDIIAGRLPRPDGLGHFPPGTVLPAR